MNGGRCSLSKKVQMGPQNGGPREQVVGIQRTHQADRELHDTTEYPQIYVGRFDKQKNRCCYLGRPI